MINGRMLAFGVLVFVVVLATLPLVQLAGLGTYAGFIAGVVAASAVMLGSLVLFKPSTHA
jgi:hypothetical protein